MEHRALREGQQGFLTKGFVDRRKDRAWGTRGLESWRSKQEEGGEVGTGSGGLAWRLQRTLAPLDGMGCHQCKKSIRFHVSCLADPGLRIDDKDKDSPGSPGWEGQQPPYCWRQPALYQGPAPWQVCAQSNCSPGPLSATALDPGPDSRAGRPEGPWSWPPGFLAGR